MPDTTNVLFTEMNARYAEQRLPWDQELPPPEVLDIVEAVPPGRALDLGCGLGRSCLYLARHGWQCDGVDFVESAIAIARERAERAGSADRIRFHHASVDALDFLDTPYDLVIDVGCLHAQTPKVQASYARHVERLLTSGGLFLLFAHVDNATEAAARRWIASSQIEVLFGRSFTIERTEYGSTTVGNDTWQSGWYWMRRR